MLKRLFAGLSLFVIPVLAQGCGWPDGPTAGNTPREMFEGLIESPVPEDVREIEGVGDLWQSYNIWLRFKASDAFIESLLAQGYVRVAWEQVAGHMRLPDQSGYHRFRPSWNPEAIEGKECFAGYIRCRWSGQHSGEHFLVIDRRTGTVYFFGAG
jgi:hypothetical protein